MTEHLFVYGTLAPGRVNAHILEALGGTWQKATVQGILQPSGWGAELGYPAIILNENADEVPGYLFSSNRLSEHWEILDAFEGEEYERVATQVKLASSESVPAYVYALKVSHEESAS